MFNAIQYLMEKTYQVVWDSLLDQGRLDSQQTVSNLEKALDVAYEDVFRGSDSIWCVKGLLVTKSILVVTWKIGPQIGIIS